MRRILILLAITLMAGCAAHKVDNLLTSTLDGYGAAIRWNGFDAALQYLDPAVLKKDPPTALELARFQQVRVSQYEDGGPVRVSPTEVEEILYATGLVGECIAFGVPNPALGQAVCVIATGKDAYPLDAARLLSECRQRMPTYMVPAVIDVREGPLPRNPNGKIDRKVLSAEFDAKNKAKP